MNEERKGESYIIGEALLWGLFPVLTILGYSALPSLISLGLTTLFAAFFFALVLTFRGRWREIFDRGAAFDIAMTTLLIGVVFYALFYTGLTMTSAGNAAIVSLAEAFFSFCLFNLWHRESISSWHVVGAALMVLGAGIVLLPRAGSFHPGDLFVLLAVAISPFGNFFQRRARARISSEAILFVRSAASVPFIFFLAYLLGERLAFVAIPWILVLVFLVNGFFVFGLSKMLWIEAIRRINVVKANGLQSLAPLVTLLFAYLLLHQAPTAFQLVAFVPMAAGVYLLSRPS